MGNKMCADFRSPRFEPDNLDGKMRGNVAWLILTLLAVEAVFGTPAAVYVDVTAGNSYSCVWTPTMALTLGQIVALEMVVRPLTPYIIPFLVLAYPIFVSGRAIKVRIETNSSFRMFCNSTTTSQAMENSKLKSTLSTCLLLALSYFLLNIFYASLLVYESATLLSGDRAVQNNQMLSWNPT